MTKQWINFQKIKELADFELVLNHFGVTGQTKGNEVTAPCPFHEEKTPSFKANLEKKVFNCFGCGNHGGLLEFATLANGGDPKNSSDLRAGAKVVMDVCGIETPKSRKVSKKTVSTPAGGAKPSTREKDAENTEKAGSGDSVASDSPKTDNPPLKFALSLEPSHELLSQRGIDDKTKQVFGVGYCDRPKSIMYKRVCFPIHNESGELVAYAGRWAEGEMPEDVRKYKLPDGFKKSLVLYNLNRVLELDSKTRHIVIVEGFWSALRLHMAGVPVVATMGTSISESQIRLLKDAGIKAVTLIFDGDEAGRKATENALPSLARSFFVRAVDLPDGIKPDTMDESLIAKVK